MGNFIRLPALVFILAVHISPDEAGQVSDQLKKDNPQVIPFTKILEERNF